MAIFLVDLQLAGSIWAYAIEPVVRAHAYAQPLTY